MQDIAGDQVPVARMPDPQPDAPIGLTGMLVDGAQPVMAAMPAADLHPDPSRLKIEFVVQNDHGAGI